ncbi:MAG: PorT family protein [Cyclobacteriaceae bacterium]|nr:PorT family protein [Cyclobacteriaceae bacterium]
MRYYIVITTLAALLSLQSHAQITFEKGYFVNESDQKIDCLIKNVDWRNNPSVFQYKLSEAAPVEEAKIDGIKEFGIYGYSKYVRYSVKIDISGNQIDELSHERNPVFDEETLFLKVLIEGKASLYLYQDKSITRFFYKVDTSAVTQLVYRRYLANSNKIVENNLYKQQLLTELKCQGITVNDVTRIGYFEKDLERFFSKFNICTGSENEIFETKKRDYFNLALKAGVNLSSLSIDNSISNLRDTNFGSNINYRFGVEAEIILPFNKNKWAIITEPSYQYFNSEKSEEYSLLVGGKLISKVDYQSIQIPVGLRYSIFLKSGFKIFSNASYIMNLSNNSSITFNREDGSLVSSLDIKPTKNVSLGIGCTLKEKLSFEVRYQSNINLLGNYSYWFSSYKNLSIMLGYKLF